MDEEELKADPLIFCHFASGLRLYIILVHVSLITGMGTVHLGVGEPKYLPVPSWQSLNGTLVEALDSYNEMNAIMNLVLFGDAMKHMLVLYSYCMHGPIQVNLEVILLLLLTFFPSCFSLG